MPSIHPNGLDTEHAAAQAGGSTMRSPAGVGGAIAVFAGIIAAAWLVCRAAACYKNRKERRLRAAAAGIPLQHLHAAAPSLASGEAVVEGPDAAVLRDEVHPQAAYHYRPQAYSPSFSITVHDTSSLHLSLDDSSLHGIEADGGHSAAGRPDTPAPFARLPDRTFRSLRMPTIRQQRSFESAATN